MEFTTNKNIITAYGTINDGDGIKFSNLFDKVESTNAEIILKLHTYGGSVFDGNIIYNAISNSSANVIIHIVGIAASMGAVISLASNTVLMAENGYLMIHAPSGGTNGTASDHENNINLLRSMEANFISKLIEKTGKVEQDIKPWLIGDNWFDANQALNVGLITGILKPETQIKKDFNPMQLGEKAVFNRFSALMNNTNLNKNTMDLRQELINKFKLKKGVSDTSIISAIEQQETEISELRESIISLLALKSDATDEEILTTIESLQEANKGMQEEKKVEASFLIANAIRTGKVMGNQKEFLKTMFKANHNQAKTFLQNTPERVTITSQMQSAQNSKQDNTPRSDWGIDEYRKFAPKELENDRELYDRLIKAKYNKK